MEIRKIALSDQKAFCDFEDELLEDKRTNPFIEWWPIEDFKAFVSQSNLSELKQLDQSYSPFTRYFAFVDGAIAGFVICFWEMEHPDCLTLGHLGYMVAPSFRHQGVAQALIDFALSQYRSRNIGRLLLAAHKDNQASRQLIEKIGARMIAQETVNHMGNQLKLVRYELIIS